MALSTALAPLHSLPFSAPRTTRGQNDSRKEEKEEMWRAQQAVLQRRKKGTWQKDVQDRRALVRRYETDPDYKKKVDEDKRARAKAERAADPPVSLFDIILPLAPFGIPEYDLGERFDLKGKYCETGYVDEDADVGQQFKRFLSSFGRKKAPPEDPKKR